MANEIDKVKESPPNRKKAILAGIAVASLSGTRMDNMKIIEVDQQNVAERGFFCI